VQTARDHTSQAVVDAIKLLPYNIIPRASSLQAIAAPLPTLKRSSSFASPSPRPIKSMKYKPGPMQFFVVRTNGKVLTIYLPLRFTIDDVKGEIEKIENLPTDEQRLIFKGKQLEDGTPLYYVTSTHSNVIVL
jgi:hypothetical protein